MLKEDINDKRKERHHITQEDFTPPEICELLCEDNDELYSDFTKTFCDICSGTGNIFIYVLKKRLKYCKSEEDVYNALRTMYGTELMYDNVEESYKNILYNLMTETSEMGFDLNDKTILNILRKNIVCTDTFKWDYENWKPMYESKQLELFE